MQPDIRALCLAFVFILGIYAAPSAVQAQDRFLGTWRAEGPEGTLTLTLKRQGEWITGTMTDASGATIQLSEGEVDEGELYMMATFQGMMFECWGELNGPDELIWTLEVEEGVEQEVRLKRVGSQAGPGPSTPPDPGAPSQPPSRNPLDPAPTTPKASPYEGQFDKGDGSVRLELRRDGQRFTGTLTIGEGSAATRFPVQLQPASGGLEGTFGQGGDTFPLWVQLQPDSQDRRLVVTSGEYVHQLERVGPRNPLASGSGSPTAPAPTGNGYRHPDGWFAFDLPQGWRALAQDRTTITLDAGREGAYLSILCGYLDPEEVGQPVASVLQAALGDLNSFLEQQLGIAGDPSGARAIALSGQHPGAEASWGGMLYAGQTQVPVQIWMGTVVQQDVFLLAIGILDPEQADQFLPAMRQITASARFLHPPSADELKRLEGQAQSGADPLDQLEGQAQQYSRQVSINGVRLDDATIALLEQGMGILVPDNAYWYDPVCGAVGGMGGPAVGFFPPGLRLGGPLPPDASGGGYGTLTGVFVNGRELHPQDVAGLAAILGGPIPQGRYWLDGQGNYGQEGGPLAGNLLVIARANQGGGGGGGSEAWTRYKDYGGANGKTHFGSFGNGDYYFSGGGVEWWPGK